MSDNPCCDVARPEENGCALGPEVKQGMTSEQSKEWFEAMKGFGKGSPSMMNSRGPLTSSMDNVLASILGKVALNAGNPNCSGDSIDRGLILRRLLEERGFTIFWDEKL
jgi:hypothetical protein